MSSIYYFKALIIYFARHYDYIYTCYIPHASKEKKTMHIYIYIIIINVYIYIYICMQNARIYIHVYTIKNTSSI
jgi:hypothetical protein